MIDFCQLRLCPMKRNLLRWSGLLVMLAGLPGLSSAQNSKRLTVPGINNFWFVDKTVSTGGSITSRDLAMPALKKRGIRTVIVAGTAANGAVLHTASEAVLRGFKAVVPVDTMSADNAYIEQYVAYHFISARGGIAAGTTLTSVGMVKYSNQTSTN